MNEAAKPLDALVKEWRERADNFDLTYGDSAVEGAYQTCADELEQALAAHAEDAPRKHTAQCTRFADEMNLTGECWCQEAAPAPGLRECPHITIERVDYQEGRTEYEVHGERVFDSDFTGHGEICSTELTRQDAEAIAEGLRSHPELCLRCRAALKGASK